MVRFFMKSLIIDKALLVSGYVTRRCLPEVNKNGMASDMRAFDCKSLVQAENRDYTQRLLEVDVR